MTFDLVIRNGTDRNCRATSLQADIGIMDGRMRRSATTSATRSDSRRRHRQAGAARRHRQPCPYLPAVRPRHRDGRRFRQRRRARPPSAATRMVLPFACSRRARACAQVVTRLSRARPTAIATSTSRFISSSPTRPTRVLGQELPALVEDGYTSFKVFMTYEGSRSATWRC